MGDSPKKRFMLGRGEKLAEKIPYRRGFGESQPPYSLSEQKRAIGAQLEELSRKSEALPSEACPQGQVVSQFTLNPQYLSRSAFPEALFKTFDLRLIGSRPVKIRPRKGRGADVEEGVASTTLYVAATKSALRAFHDTLQNLDGGEPAAEDLLKLERIDFFSAENRVLGKIPVRSTDLEVVVHFDALLDADWEQDFYCFAKQAGIKIDKDHIFQSRGLLFLPAVGDVEAAKNLAQFTFVRAIRPMPKLRIIDRPSILRSNVTVNTQLPSEPPIDPSFKIAVFDGGLKENHPFGRWAREIAPPATYDIGDPVPDYQDHGTAVTSAALFGHIAGGTLPRPFAAVDHFRVLGANVRDKHLYQVMLYVDEVLSQSNYPLVSFSIGPHEVAGEDNVTAWTAMLDDHFGQGEILAAIAVGNDGDAPWPDCRIQVPSDCVNALAIGASNSMGSGWKRAPYSSIGPGRHPGLIKPDLLHFGGVDTEQFRFVFPGPIIAEGCGTSYATPATIRIAAGLKAYFGNELSVQAIRALLIHTAERGDFHPDEVGWGKVSDDLDSIVSCGKGVVRIVYKGRLEPGKVLRAPIPIPEEELKGDVSITATFCYGCQTDPHTPGEYTRAGLDITFRPHKDKFDKDPAHPKPDGFFKQHERSKEQDLRRDAHKWDTVLHGQKTKRGSSLADPTFDIHYLAREPGTRASPSQAVKLPYALIITVESKRTPDIYEKVEQRYRHRLSAMQPRIELPVSIQT